MGGSILYILILVLRVFSQPIPDIFHKSLRIAKIFTKNDLEFFPEYNNIRPFFLSIPAFILCPVSANAVPKKRNCKQSMILSVDSICIEMVFILLAKPIVIQMWFSKTQVGKPSLEKLFNELYWYWGSKSLDWGLSLIVNDIYISLHE